MQKQKQIEETSITKHKKQNNATHHRYFSFFRKRRFPFYLAPGDGKRLQPIEVVVILFYNEMEGGFQRGKPLDRG